MGNDFNEVFYFYLKETDALKVQSELYDTFHNDASLIKYDIYMD